MSLGWLDYLIVIAYLAAVIIFGSLFWRQAQERQRFLPRRPYGPLAADCN